MLAAPPALRSDRLVVEAVARIDASRADGPLIALPQIIVGARAGARTIIAE